MRLRPRLTLPCQANAYPLKLRPAMAWLSSPISRARKPAQSPPREGGQAPARASAFPLQTSAGQDTVPGHLPQTFSEGSWEHGPLSPHPSKKLLA